MSSKDVQIKEMQDQLEICEVAIQELKKRAERSNAETQVKYYKKIEELRLLQKHARQKFDELSKAGEDSWELLKQDVGSAYENVKKTLTETQKAFQEGLDESKEK